MATNEQELKEGKFFAAISYLSFLCIVTLLFKKDNQFALYHAKQGLVLFVLEVASFLVSIVPFLGAIIRTLGAVVFTVATVWGIFQALTGKEEKMPVVSRIADSITL